MTRIAHHIQFLFREGKFLRFTIIIIPIICMCCLLSCGVGKTYTLTGVVRESKPSSPSSKTYISRGFHYTIRKGDNLTRIAGRFGTTVSILARCNKLKNPDRIYIGQRIYIPPRGTGVSPLTVAKKPSTTRPSIKKPSIRATASKATSKTPSRTPTKTGKTIVASTNRGISSYGFILPVRTGWISQYFNDRKNPPHKGVDIAAPYGTPIYAMKSGKVIDSCVMKGYGKVIMIQHKNSYISVYAHNSRNLVKYGDYVERGQKIALVGSTGRSTGNHLHLEIRAGRDPKAVNPLKYLPPFKKSGRS